MSGRWFWAPRHHHLGRPGGSGQRRQHVPRLHKVTAGVHCNMAVNPQTTEAQVQGAVLAVIRRLLVQPSDDRGLLELPLFLPAYAVHCCICVVRSVTRSKNVLKGWKHSSIVMIYAITQEKFPTVTVSENHGNSFEYIRTMFTHSE